MKNTDTKRRYNDATVKMVYAYVIPNSFVRKNQYDQYKKELEKILFDYDLIKDVNEIKRRFGFENVEIVDYKILK